MARKSAPTPFLMPCFNKLEGAALAIEQGRVVQDNTAWYGSSEKLEWAAHTDHEDIIKLKLSNLGDVVFVPLSMKRFGEIMQRHGYGFISQEQAVALAKPRPQQRLALPKPL
jgi:hypothetical protein